MIVLNRGALLTLACTALVMSAQAIVPSLADPSEPAPDLSAMAATPTPVPDLSSMATPAATPTPDASGTTTPAASSEIQPEQMKGDGVLELSEEQPAELLPSGNAAISALANQAKNVTDDLSKAIDQIKQQHAQLQGQLGQIESELDAFYQKSGTQRGKIGEILQEAAQPLTTQPATPIPVTPNAVIPTAPVTSPIIPGLTIPPM